MIPKSLRSGLTRGIMLQQGLERMTIRRKVILV